VHKNQERGQLRVELGHITKWGWIPYKSLIARIVRSYLCKQILSIDTNPKTNTHYLQPEMALKKKLFKIYLDIQKKPKVAEIGLAETKATILE